MTRTEGDGWDLRRGDSLSVLRGLDSNSVDAVISDPPYCSGGAYRGDRLKSSKAKYVQSNTKRDYEDFHGEARDAQGFALWVALWCSQLARVMKPGAPWMLFGDWRQLPLMSGAVQAGGLVFRGIAVWNKGRAVRHFKSRPAAQAEYILWGSNGAMPAREDVPALAGVFHHPSPRKRDHIAQKPVALMRELVAICPPGGRILDPFAGSGTTMVAALESGREAVGIELSEHWFDHAAGRLRAASGAEMSPAAGRLF